MCTESCIAFGRGNLLRAEVKDKAVLDVGAIDVNGSLRGTVQALSPRCYVGVDIEEGPGVDEICNVANLVDTFGRDSFDVVLTTELMEHVEDWRTAISNLKNVLRPNGTLLLTTRSKGVAYHGYPYDFWRYEPSDMEAIFSDLTIEKIEMDPIGPGVMVKAKKGADFVENDLSDHCLYSIVSRRRIRDSGEITVLDRCWCALKCAVRSVIIAVLPACVKSSIRRRIVAGREKSRSVPPS